MMEMALFYFVGFIPEVVCIILRCVMKLIKEHIFLCQSEKFDRQKCYKFMQSEFNL